jgi:hypothetical protein
MNRIVEIGLLADAGPLLCVRRLSRNHRPMKDTLQPNEMRRSLIQRHLHKIRVSRNWTILSVRRKLESLNFFRENAPKVVV